MPGLTGVSKFDLDATNVVVLAGEDVLQCDLPAGCGTATPRKVAAGYPYGVGLSLKAPNVLFSAGEPSNSDYRYLWSCPLLGCNVDPSLNTQLGKRGNVAFQDVIHGPDHVLWTGVRELFVGGTEYRNRGEIFFCANATCGAADSMKTMLRPNVGEGDEINGYRALTANATTVFYATQLQSNPGQWVVRSCPIAESCVVSANITTIFDEIVKLQLDSANVLFGANEGTNTQGVKGEIWSMSPTQKLVALDDAGVRDFVLDATHVYWINDKTNKVQRCLKTGCVGGAELLATATGKPLKIKVDSSYVYWVTATDVFRLAKP